VWLTQRYSLQAQLAIKRADAEAAVAAAQRAEEVAVAAALRPEREKRCLAILQNLDSLYVSNAGHAGRKEFLQVVREVWLLGDEELVRKMRALFAHLTMKGEATAEEQLFGDVVLHLRKGLGLSVDRLSNEDFHFLGPES
jgi:hypothetical protein